MQLFKCIYRICIVFVVVCMLGCTGCARKAVVITSDFNDQELYMDDVSKTERTAYSEDRPTAETGRMLSMQSETERMTYTAEKSIAVFVCGAVNDPGVYYMHSGDRASDAVEAAGGFSQDADTQWVNLASYIEDGQKLIIYTRDETRIMPQECDPGFTALDDKNQKQSFSNEIINNLVNLNTADKNTLMTLPGIGSARADAIIAYRNAHGGFSSVNEICQISGIKNSVFDNIKDQITV